eukprot:752297-Hanusia_phi.AAC.3
MAGGAVLEVLRTASFSMDLVGLPSDLLMRSRPLKTCNAFTLVEGNKEKGEMRETTERRRKFNIAQHEVRRNWANVPPWEHELQQDTATE